MKEVWNWLVENWIVITVAAPIVLAFLYAIAKRTKTTKDDEAVSFLMGLWKDIVSFVTDMKNAFSQTPKKNN